MYENYENPFAEKYLVIAEKPSVAKTIAAAMGCKDQKDGYIESPDYVVTWCYGHLAEYAMPDAYDPVYLKWSLETLPIIPDQWKLVVSEDKKKQFRLLSELLNDSLNGKKQFFSAVVNACDAGREGELIFNRVYELSGSTLPVRRLWISSMEDDAIFQGFMNMKDAVEYRNLADASVCRAQADWLVGMNASRAFTKAYDSRFSVGRVQSPTLAMLVERAGQIENFQKEQYFVTHLLVDSMGKTIDAASEHFSDREEANRLAGTCSGRTATVPSIERQMRTIMPPPLYDLTTLQRDANRLFGFTAADTLRFSQKLYENKLITYPRTDCRYLTDDMGQTAVNVLNASVQTFPFLSPSGSSSAPVGTSAGTPSVSAGNTAAYAYNAGNPDVARLLNSKKVTDHHAIIPTVMIRSADLSGLQEEEKKILILVVARLVSAAGKKHVYETVKASFRCCGYSFTAAGRNTKEEGWKATEAAMRRHCHAAEDSADKGQPSMTGIQDLSSLYQGAQFTPVSTKVTDHWTQPPKHYTEDSLLHAMEAAGASDMESDVERKGLGTPATRAGIIDRLVGSKYVVRSKRQLIATETGRQLISILPDYLKSAKMTADWENQLLQIERGQYSRQAFMDGITQMIRRIVHDCRQLDENERNRFSGHNKDNTGRSGRESLGKCPVCGSPVYEGEKNFYCSNRSCRFTLWKENRYLSRMRTCLDEGMVKDILANGRTHVKDLYSPKKDKFFSADLVMEWKNGKAAYSLDFSDGHQ